MSLNDDTDEVLLIRAEMNCYLHNQLLCNSIKVFYCRWEEILSSEKTTQGDPTSMMHMH